MSKFIRRLKINLVLFLKFLKIEVPPIPTVSCIIEKDKKILMLHLNYRSGYALPGGGIQAGENAEEAVIRECKEELGQIPTKLNYFSSASTEKDGLDMFHISFTGDLTSTEFTISSEGTPEWLDLKDALVYCAYKDQIKILELYKKINHEISLL